MKMTNGLKALVDPYFEMLHGKHARQTDGFVIVQDMGEAGQLYVGLSKGHELSYEAPETHVLIIGNMIVTPKLVMASNHLRGSGIAHVATSGGNADEWVAAGRVVLHPGARVI